MTTIPLTVTLDTAAMARALDEFLGQNHGVQIGIGECIKAAQLMVSAGVGSSSTVTFAFTVEVTNAVD